MELCKIKWSNHPILGDLLLDLTNDEGVPYKTIVLAGENGTGKTSILSSIYGLMDKQPLEFIEYVEYSVDGHKFQARPDPNNIRFGYYFRHDLNDMSEKHIRFGHNSFSEENNRDPYEFRNYGHIYSSARSGFKTSSIKSSTTSQLDSDKMGDDEDYDYTKIKQLFIDLNVQDNSEWMRKTKEADSRGTSADFSEFVSESRTFRFSKAFNEFFGDYLTYGDVDHTDPGEIIVRFNRNGIPVSIDDLSTGEKQIVFRGAYCLRNMKWLDGGVVLIDEPELSMHPKWQKKILDFYRNLFSIDDRQMPQLIVATHSQFVLSSSLMDPINTKVIILSHKDNSARSESVKEFALSPKVPSEVNYAAFGIISEDYLLALYCYIQESRDFEHIKDVDSFLDNHHLFLDTMIRVDNSHKTEYRTLPTYIRNAICHPNSDRTYSEDELHKSIEFLRSICFELNSSNPVRMG